MRVRPIVRKALTGLLDTGVEFARRTFLPALGGVPDTAQLARSSRYRGGAFHNSASARWVPPGTRDGLLREIVRRAKHRHPSGDVPVIRDVPDAATSGLHITWFGHASSLIELDGARLLLDPVFSDRVSPLPGVGPRRMHPVPRELADLPELDAVIVSHDHYDHLDMATVRKLAHSRSMPFVVPLGVATHLRHWGIPGDRIIELDWNESFEVAGVTIMAAAAQHFSGRALTRNNTLWASWVLAGASHRVFYTGDSGYFDGYADVGARYGPFDATLVQIGAYNAAWPDIHMTPEEGVAAHSDVRGDVLIPVHWATFNLALHPWSEPADRVWAEAKAMGVALAVPRPGERIDVAALPAVDSWWKAVE